MAVPVHFPDGSIRDIPGQLRPVAGTGVTDRPLRYEQVPLNRDAGWRFERRMGIWTASPRLGHLVPIRPPLLAWWSAIPQMHDLDTVGPSTDRSAA
jgi:hypothetical protein